MAVVCLNDGEEMHKRLAGGFVCPECGHVAGVRVAEEVA
jgi:hypothetical protein